MAISGFGRGTKGGTGNTGAPMASSSSSSSSNTGGIGNLTAFIDQGSEFEGKLSFKDTVRIDGTFSGEISSDNTLIIGETGEIHAKIRSVCVVVSGFVEGDIVASQQVVLHKTAVVNGDIHSPSFVVEEGAQMNGAVRMGANAASSGKGSGNSNGNPNKGQEAKSDGGGSKQPS